MLARLNSMPRWELVGIGRLENEDSPEPHIIFNEIWMDKSDGRAGNWGD